MNEKNCKKMKLSVESVLLFIGIGLVCVFGADEVNDDANPDVEDKEIFRNLVRPFRMEKLNLIWVKAQQVNKHIIHYWPKKKNKNKNRLSYF